jgi:hypothetical protein
MMIQPLYEDSPGMAVSEALRLYQVGRECKAALDLGVTERQLCVMTGLSISAMRECLKVLELFPTDEEFLKSFQKHDIVAGASHRTWATFLLSLGINTISQREAQQILATVKQSVQRIAMVAQGTADPEVAQKTLGSLRAWLSGRIPPTVWATIDRNFFLYQKCSFCSNDAEEPELLEINGLLATRCNQCKSEGVNYSSINWETVALAYAAYAFECNNAAEIYRTI